MRERLLHAARAGLILTLSSICLVMVCAADAGAQGCPSGARCQSTTGPLAPLWAKLNKAREYRCLQGGTSGRCQRNSYDQMVQKYTASSVDLGGASPKEVFFSLATNPASGFRAYINNAQYREWSIEAQFGLQEAINELMVGQLLIGNDYLLKGLRTRFPNTGDPADPDQLTLLRESVSTFQEAIAAVIEEIRLRPQNLRARGTVNQTFQFYVENSRKRLPDGNYEGQGNLVENEMYQYTELVRLAGLSANSVAKRIFFFENDKPGGPELASAEMKRAAQLVFLNNAVLNSVQTSPDFRINRGHDLKRQVVDAQRVFDDVASGFNPLKLQGDFVPHQPFESLMAAFSSLVSDAVSKEQAASQLGRQYDQDQTALQSELLNQEQGYFGEIAALTGIPASDLSGYGLSRVEERQRLLSDAESNLLAGKGQLGILANAVSQAAIDARIAVQELKSIPEKIRIEEERNQQVARLTLASGQAQVALEVAELIARSWTITCCNPFSSGISIQPLVIALQPYKTQVQLQRLANDIEIQNINSAATVKNLLLQQITAAIGVERAGKVIEARRAELDEGMARLERTMRNFLSAQSNLTTAYFSNPAYRLQLDLARENANASFEAAMVQGYFAAKVLEYEWAETVRNPVEKLDGTLPEPIGDSGTFNGITSAESVFGARSAGAPDAPSPSLVTFRQALQLWDSKMRQLRFPAQQVGSTIRLSLRKDILPYGEADEATNRAQFTQFIKQNRVPGANGQKRDLILEFNLPIANQRFLPAVPNLKIENVRVQLRSLPGKSLRGAGSTGNAALVNLVMLDSAQIRRFFADYPDDDDILIVDLQEGRNLFDSPFFAQVESAVDGFPVVGAPNTQLQGHSPAVTRWTLWIDMENGENRNLELENLDDIEIEVTYRYGRPRPFSF